MRYVVTGFDICVPGFERLRYNDEFILLAFAYPRATWEDLLNGWKDDLGACAEFVDQELCRQAISDWAAEHASQIDKELVGLPGYCEPEGDLVAFLYVKGVV